MKIILRKIMMTTHQQKGIIGVATTRELSKVVICNISLTLCCRIMVVIFNIFVSFFRIIKQPIIATNYIRTLIYITMLKFD